jgi:hypothetical protein
MASKSETTSRTESRPLARPISCQYLPEPLLVFGGGGQHVSPKSGVARYGPRSYGSAERHPASVRVGLIGTAETIEKTRSWLEASARGVAGDAKHPEFSGYQADRGFFSTLQFHDDWVGQITQSELEGLLGIRAACDRFEAAVGLLEEKLRLLSEQDQPPQYVVVGLPNDLLRRCRVAEYRDSNLGMVHRDLRRAFKAAAMKYRIPTQLLRQPTMEGRDKDHPSKIAWNFFTGLYFKAGGIPWGPTGLSPGTCYVGISFYRPLGSRFSQMHTSLVQAFDEHGEGLVLRGHDIEWDPGKEGSRSPHLSQDQAHDLIQMVLVRYEQEMKQTPRRVVVHKTSQYWPAEREGFRGTLRQRVDRYDLLTLQPQSEVRLITASKYPPLRGTRFSFGDLDFLYTTGFVAEIGEFHGLHVPSPLRISDHVGQDTGREALLAEILTLTKVNWNSAQLGGLMPITLKFSRLAGDIMREIPRDRDPLPQFKFYM